MSTSDEPKLKIDTKLDAIAEEGLEMHIQDLYDRLGSEIMVIATLRAVDHNDPEEGSGVKPWVKVRLVGAEVATPAQSNSLRKLASRMYEARTNEGDDLIKLTQDLAKL